MTSATSCRLETCLCLVLQDQCYEEQLNVFGKDGAVDYDGVKQCELLDRCMKESLRLRPPIFTMMRLAMNPQVSLSHCPHCTGETLLLSPLYR